MRTRTFVVLGLAVALLLAGFVSFYASGRPDGLEYVAQTAGFDHSAEAHPASDGPLADYGTRGVDDPRLSGGLAGVVGTLVTLGLTSGLVIALRRRRQQG